MERPWVPQQLTITDWHTPTVTAAGQGAGSEGERMCYCGHKDTDHVFKQVPPWGRYYCVVRWYGLRCGCDEYRERSTP